MKNKLTLSLQAVLVVAALLAIGSYIAGSFQVEAVSPSFGASADSYVHSGKADENLGTATKMEVDGNATKIRRSLVQFDVSSIPGGPLSARPPSRCA